MKAASQKTDLFREAAEWRLMSLLFECPTGDWKTQVKKLACEIGDPDLKKAAESAQTEASEGLYHSVFGPGGPAPAREVSYRDWVQPGYLLSELAAFYDAFSYQPCLRETPDHIAVETGFIAYLKLKEAFAEECSESEKAKVTAEAADNFVAEHLAKMTEPIANILATSDIEYLALASIAAFKRVGPDEDKKARRILPTLTEVEGEDLECGV
jgi:nitrate reductase assembly molybdenum cofactor insertion protein NarJ